MFDAPRTFGYVDPTSASPLRRNARDPNVLEPWRLGWVRERALDDVSVRPEGREVPFERRVSIVESPHRLIEPSVISAADHRVRVETSARPSPRVLAVR